MNKFTILLIFNVLVLLPFVVQYIRMTKKYRQKVKHVCIKDSILLTKEETEKFEANELQEFIEGRMNYSIYKNFGFSNLKKNDVIEVYYQNVPEGLRIFWKIKVTPIK